MFYNSTDAYNVLMGEFKENNEWQILNYNKQIDYHNIIVKAFSWMQKKRVLLPVLLLMIVKVSKKWVWAELTIQVIG